MWTNWYLNGWYTFWVTVIFWISFMRVIWVFPPAQCRFGPHGASSQAAAGSRSPPLPLTAAFQNPLQTERRMLHSRGHKAASTPSDWPLLFETPTKPSNESPSSRVKTHLCACRGSSAPREKCCKSLFYTRV